MNTLSTLGQFLTGRGYEPHGECLLWTPGLVALHVVSDGLIALAYFSIPCLLVYFVSRRRGLPFGFIFVMFSLFIVSCGITHAIAIYEIWHGAYWFSGLAKSVTAVISIATAFMMVPLLPKALALRTPAELEMVNGVLSASLVEKQRLIEQLERERQLGATIRNNFLPELPEPHDDISFDAAYIPAEDETRLGGDWYSAFRLPDGRYVISIGDVVGHGLKAAIAMDRFRTAISMGCINAPTPSAALERVNNLATSRKMPYATAFVAILDPKSMRLDYASAGHPPPLVVDDAGDILQLDVGGTMLGVTEGAAFTTSSWDLSVGTRVIFYTDGLIEYSRDILEGEARLRAIAPTALGSVTPATELLRRALGDYEAADDVAVLILSIGSVASVAAAVRA